jgi:predicted aspartyl protease
MKHFRFAILLILAATSALADTITLQMVNRRFFLEGYLGNTPVKFLVDTGAVASLIPRAAANAAGEYRNCVTKRMRTAGGYTEVCERTFSSIRIGESEYAHVVAVIGEANPHGLLGMDILSKYVISVDDGVMTLKLKSSAGSASRTESKTVATAARGSRDDPEWTPSTNFTRTRYVPPKDEPKVDPRVAPKAAVTQRELPADERRIAVEAAEAALKTRSTADPKPVLYKNDHLKSGAELVADKEGWVTVMGKK